MSEVFKRVLRFKRKYPLTVAWRLRKNSSVIDKHLNPGEKVLYAFIAQKNDNPLNFFETGVVALTNKRILIGRKRVIFGYFLDSITPDMFNDLKVNGGIIWGKVHIDTVKELVTLSNIDITALPELETAVSSYMIQIKKKYGNSVKDKD
ncbi:MAG: PH domain-containing protein [Bacilli bacterium]|nr:PH domain-containing protein [Bacilli bacterium]MBR3162470.1 PH domain-containing protein [Bacilli bacterium]